MPDQPLILLPQPRTVNWHEQTSSQTADDAPSTRIDPQTVAHAQGYRLTINPEGIEIVGHDEAGVFYAQQTLAQISQQASPLPCVSIEDWPDFIHRGVMLDISRDKVPTMDTLLALVERLASWKINELQLYTEHTFAYPQHREVWQNASPMTGEQIETLDAHCARHHVELVPNQNSLGHMERFLQYDSYKHLAEMPDQAPDKPRNRPAAQRGVNGSTLYPLDPASIEFIDGLYEQLLDHFSSRRFNVGGDEPWELGKGRSADEAKRLSQGEQTNDRGIGRIYLDFMLELYRRVTGRGRTMMFWAEIVGKHPELIPELPADLIALEWGYHADHPFDERAGRFAKTGLPFYVCPGTGAWNSFVGRTDNAVKNLANAAEAGKKHAALGYLITDWGDNGHAQPLCVSFLGYAWGAAMSWSVDANRDLDLCTALSRFAFNDEANVMGKLVYDLGNGDTHAGYLRRNKTELLDIMIYPHIETDYMPGCSLEHLDRFKDWTQATIARLDQARMTCPDSALIREELLTMADLVVHATELGKARLNHEQDPQVPETLIERYQQIWLARNRPGGLTESQATIFGPGVGPAVSA